MASLDPQVPLVVLARLDPMDAQDLQETLACKERMAQMAAKDHQEEQDQW